MMMRASIVPVVIALLSLCAVPHAALQGQEPSSASRRTGGDVAELSLHLTSADLKGTFAPSQIFNGFGCTGGNVSPQLSWTGAPAGTKSFALTVFDPDAPTGSGWWHWVVVNIPVSAAQLPAGASGAKMPAGALETRTDFGKPGYGGPCPPASDPPHHYVFTLYALKVEKLDLDAQASGAMAGFMIRQNKLASAALTATYARK
jgi:Raf kinase inhibitor-like YbhB/YbcL family protein